MKPLVNQYFAQFLPSPLAMGVTQPCRRRTANFLVAAVLTFAAIDWLKPPSVVAYPLVVVEARGGALKPGARIDSNVPVTLKPSEKLVVISPDGKISTLRGDYKGSPIRDGAAVQSARVALGALISTRNDRANTVGAVRSGSSASPLPEPWLIDISRPGERCVREGAQPVWWRPSATEAGTFSVYPVDRSWKADFEWSVGEDRMKAPPLMRMDGVKMIIIRTGDQERPVRMHVLPNDIDDPVVLTAWMLEKACVQQADALLRSLESNLEATALMDASNQAQLPALKQ